MPLSESTRKSLNTHIQMWKQVGLSTTRANRESAEGAIKHSYSIVGLPAPSRFVWLDSPMAGAIAAAQASGAFQSTTGRVWRKPQEFMLKKLWQRAEASQSLQHYKEAEDYINKSPLLGLRNLVLMPVAKQIVDQHSEKTTQARVSVFTRAHHSGSNLSTDVWNRALMGLKQHLTQKEIQALKGSVTFEAISEQVKACSFGNMDAMFLAFLDYGNMAGFKLNDIDGLVLAAKNCGWWWAFNDICIITERPKHISLNNRMLLNQAGAKAIEYPDGWGVYAINGQIVTREVAESAVDISVEPSSTSSSGPHATIPYGQRPQE